MSFLLKIFTVTLLLRRSTNQCTNRYELKDEIKEALPYLKNCTRVRTLYPICDRTVSVYFADHPPYVSKQGNQTEPHGLIPDMLQMILDACCHGCTPIIYKGPVNPMHKFKEIKNRTLYIPLESAFDSDVFHKHEYIPFLKVDGVSFLAREASNKGEIYTSHLMESVFSTWPLFVTAILMAFTAGCVMWVLDCWFNGEEFPQRFPRGPFEGFWWAFITMTTVGYGDKAPRTWMARIFAIIWILVGITVFSMYTSVLTSALGSKTSSFGDKNFVHKEVGVLNFTSAGEAAAYEENAKVFKYPNMQVMSKALKEKRVHAIAVDNFILKFHMKHLQEIVPGIRKHHSVKTSNSYGVLSYDTQFTSMLRSFFKTNEDQRNALALHAMHLTWPTLKLPAKESADSTTFFNSHSPMFKKTLIGLCVLCVILCVVGLLCIFVFWKYPKIKESYIKLITLDFNKKKKKDVVTLKNIGTDSSRSDTVQDLLTELNEFQAKWEKKLLALRTSSNDTAAQL